ncbi:hypothetical protein CCP3SC1AL1_4100002 [Gammaproteobacteria bacterium]
MVGTNVPFLTGSYSGGSSLGSSFGNSSGLDGSGLATSSGLGVSGSSAYGGYGSGYGGYGGGVNPFQTIQRQDVGLTLKVKPQINEGNSVKLEVQQEVSALTTPPQGISTSDVVTSKRAIKTTVLVDDGQVVVLGGLIDDQVQENQNKVPFLGDIPFLGALFRSTSHNVNKRNLMVFLHPVILRDAAMTERVSGSKYSYMRERQVEAMSPQDLPRDPGLLLPPIEKLKELPLAPPARVTGPTTLENPLDQTLALPPPFEDDETKASQVLGSAPDVRP